MSHVAQMQLRNHNKGRRLYKTGESVRGPALRAARPFLGATARNRGPNSITAMREANRDSGGQWGQSISIMRKRRGQSISIVFGTLSSLQQTAGTEHINNDQNGFQTAGTEHINNDQNGFEFATKFL